MYSIRIDYIPVYLTVLIEIETLATYAGDGFIRDYDNQLA